MKKIIISAACLLYGAMHAHAFCGFFVAKAETKIFNHKSQVIMVRDGDKNTITMSNDFKGDARDFAMVVPVPVVLKKQDIKISEQILFDKLDAYSAPRLVEYYDQNPCMNMRYMNDAPVALTKSVAKESMSGMENDEKKYGVKIQAKYTVGEYDIMILSATQSSGLKDWLKINGYTIPADAHEVLDPYIRSNLKFFVAKVNLKELEKLDYQQLRPIQITYHSPKYMLPIRLGMANSDGEQDLIVYAFTQKGRVECTNYRTVRMPTAIDMPEFIQKDFGKFYADVFTKKWKREGSNVVLLEYAWDLSPNQFMKCDPCVSDPPDYNDLSAAGVDWLFAKANDDYAGQYNRNQAKVYFTRLHVRYSRATFPQDLQFQVTPNTENWQARYIIRHPASGDLSCEQAETYISNTIQRREKEINNLQHYAGWNKKSYADYPEKWLNKPYRKLYKQGDVSANKMMILLFLGIQVSVVSFVLLRKKVSFKN